MADVSYPRFFEIDTKRLSIRKVKREDLKEGNIYLMLLQVVDEDDYDVIPDNLSQSQAVLGKIWLGYYSMSAGKYLGDGILQVEDGLKISLDD